MEKFEVIKPEKLFKEGELIELGPEKDLVLNKAQDALTQGMDKIEKFNAEVYKQEGLPVISTQESKDLAAWPEELSDDLRWINYWKQRLTAEIDILPEKVQIVMDKLIKKKPLIRAEEQWFGRYVIKRLKILKNNIDKRLVMHYLKEKLRQIDKKEDYPDKEKAHRRTIFYDEEHGQFFVKEDAKKKPISFGDIVADYEYGIEYRPDDSVPEKQWRKIRKLADLTEARRKVEHIFNQELMTLGFSAGGGSTNITEQDLEKRFKETEPQDRGLEGLIAEKEVKNFLIRVQYNDPDLNFKVEPANAVEDTELKYDFKILLPEKRRGVAVEGNEMSREEFVKNKRSVGLQFTIAREGLGHKIKQVKEAKKEISSKRYEEIIKKPVDDIVLLKLDFIQYSEYFKRWLAAGKPSGGPEQYLTKEEKVRIFKETTKNFLDLSDEEIDKLAL